LRFAIAPVHSASSVFGFPRSTADHFHWIDDLLCRRSAA
jgi:hypothetical protein